MKRLEIYKDLVILDLNLNLSYSVGNENKKFFNENLESSLIKNYEVSVVGSFLL